MPKKSQMPTLAFQRPVSGRFETVYRISITQWLDENRFWGRLAARPFAWFHWFVLHRKIPFVSRQAVFVRAAICDRRSNKANDRHRTAASDLLIRQVQPSVIIRALSSQKDQLPFASKIICSSHKDTGFKTSRFPDWEIRIALPKRTQFLVAGFGRSNLIGLRSRSEA